MSSIPIVSKVYVACKVRPKFNSQPIRTLISSNVSLKTSDHLGKKPNGASTSGTVPRNIEEINSSVKAKFSPHRTRDASSARIDVKMSQPSGTFGQSFMGSQGSKLGQKINVKSRPNDSHVDVYDASNSVSLSSVMQSNVPKPFETKGTEAPAYLSMPGGQWSQGDKYVSGDLQDHHDKNITKKYPGEETERHADDLPKVEEDGGRKTAQAVAAGVSTFVLAYAIHKVFAPVRIGITLTATPFIVRHLRKIGFLKPPKSS